MKKMMQEFKDFAVRGNAIDLAVGLVIGAAFTGIVDSIVNDLINPVVGLLTRGTDFSDMAYTNKALDVTFTYGNFINAIISFLVVAFVIFMIVKQLNRLKKEAPAAEETPDEQVVLLREIRDNLKR